MYLSTLQKLKKLKRNKKKTPQQPLPRKKCLSLLVGVFLFCPLRVRKKTEGGVYLPDQAVEREALATVCGYVMKVGPLAYKDPDKFGETGAWCAEGDWVIFGRYAGSRFKIDGGEVRLLNDDEILAKINNPEDILHT